MPNSPIELIRQHSRQLVREWDILKVNNAKENMSYTRCHCLIELDKYQILTVVELASLLNLDKSTMSRCVHGLIKDEYVVYTSHNGDQRQKPLCLTEKGKEQLNHLNCNANEQVSNALDLLTEKEILQVKAGLKLYSKALNRSRLQKAYQIRPIMPEDNLYIARIVKEVMAEFSISESCGGEESDEMNDMYSTYNREGAAYWIVEKGGKILGGGGIFPLKGIEEKICEFRRMYFLPETRGLGLGRKLLSQALEEAKKMGYTRCYLETTSTMYQARNLYQAFGFTERQQPLGKTGDTACEAYFERKL